MNRQLAAYKGIISAWVFAVSFLFTVGRMFHIHTHTYTHTHKQATCSIQRHLCMGFRGVVPLYSRRDYRGILLRTVCVEQAPRVVQCTVHMTWSGFIDGLQGWASGFRLQASGFQASGFRLQASGMGLFYIYVTLAEHMSWSCGLLFVMVFA